MKKRILSLILALSMVLSVFPLGAFAADPPELVMKDGFPEASNGGKISCSGNGWKYNHNDGTLYLNDGTCDFSSTHPKNPSVGTKPAPAVQCLISIMNAEITDGSFSTTVYNSSGGTISDGTFHGEVRNAGTISGGTFSATVKIYYGGKIFDGTFNGEVISSGTITSGTFAGSVDNRSGTVTGGAFNGNTALTDARHVTVTNGSLLKVNGVDPRNADGTTGTAWDLYSYKDTTMTITANTEIFSLNGKSIGDGNCNSSYGSDRTTVTFTMPGEPVVLNRTAELEVVGGEIKSGETAKGSGRVLIGSKVEVTTKDKNQDFVGWTIAPEGIELRDDDGREVDLTSEWTFSFMMPDVSGGKLTPDGKLSAFPYQPADECRRHGESGACVQRDLRWKRNPQG